MKKRISILVLGLFVGVLAYAQQATQMRFNEVLVTNHSNYVDGYGERVAWIELFNTSYNVVNIGGCYLTNDPNQPMMYMIPKGDVLTRIQQRQHVLFYADGKPGRGTFHLNFTLDSASVNTIYLFNADGKSMIDSVVVPVLPADVSWGSLIDGDSNWSMMQRVTPSTNNKTLDSNEKIERFSQEDPDGVGMSLSAVSVVFAVLLLLAVFFSGLANVIKRASNSGKKSQATVKPTAVDPNEVPGEVMAAISMALYEMSNDAHDIENTVLTIARTRRSYSPWSSKIYGLREIPNKK